jgi:hypothetical protein
MTDLKSIESNQEAPKDAAQDVQPQQSDAGVAEQQYQELLAHVRVSGLYRYIGEYMLQGQCLGTDVRTHAEALDILSQLFNGNEAVVKTHPQFPRFLAEQQHAAEQQAQAQQQRRQK